MALKLVITLGVQLVARGLWGRRSERLSRFLAWTTVISLTLGIAALIMMTSVMNGFDMTLRSRLLSIVPHLVVDGRQARSSVIAGTESAQLTAVSSFLSAEGMIIGDEQFYVKVQGVSDQDPIRRSLENQGTLIGRWPEPNSGVAEIAIGAPLARRADLVLGGDVLILFPRVERGRLQPLWHRFKVTGLFSMGAEVDYVTAITTVAEMSTLLGDSSHWRLTLSDPSEVTQVKTQLQGAGINLISSWDEEYASFFRAVKIEKFMMAALLGLLVLLSLISLLSSVQRTLAEKRGVASMLQASGLTKFEIQCVFMTYGASLSIFALALGAILGSLASIALPTWMAWIESITGLSVVRGS
ncbi:MAG: ABC transporter permease [Pseudomonadales bacterium]